jgi:hypothetical protein
MANPVDVDRLLHEMARYFDLFDVSPGTSMSKPPSSELQPIAKPPACPQCHTSANVALHVEAGTGQMWTCTACGVRWEVRLTPRTER